MAVFDEDGLRFLNAGVLSAEPRGETRPEGVWIQGSHGTYVAGAEPARRTLEWTKEDEEDPHTLRERQRREAIMRGLQQRKAPPGSVLDQAPALAPGDENAAEYAGAGDASQTAVTAAFPRLRPNGVRVKLLSAPGPQAGAAGDGDAALPDAAGMARQPVQAPVDAQPPPPRPQDKPLEQGHGEMAPPKPAPAGAAAPAAAIPPTGTPVGNGAPQAPASKQSATLPAAPPQPAPAGNGPQVRGGALGAQPAAGAPARKLEATLRQLQAGRAADDYSSWEDVGDAKRNELLKAKAQELGMPEAELRKKLEMQRLLDWSKPSSETSHAVQSNIAYPLWRLLGWVDLAEPTRWLPDNTLVPNPAVLGDREDFDKAIDASNAPPHVKEATRARWEQYHQAWLASIRPMLETMETIPGVENYMGWRERMQNDPKEGPDFNHKTEEQKAEQYLQEQKQRGTLRKLADNISSNLLAGSHDIVTGLAGTLAALSGSQMMAEYAAEKAAEAQRTVGALELTGNDGFANAVVGGVARALPGLAAAYVTGGVGAVIQGGGTVYADVYNERRSQGLTHEAADQAATTAAAAGAVLSAVLSKVMPGAGRAGAGGLTAQAVRQEMGTALQAVINSAAKTGVSMARGALEEMSDELVDGAVSHFTAELAKGRTWEEAAASYLEGLPTNLATAGVMGGGSGARGGGAGPERGAGGTTPDGAPGAHTRPGDAAPDVAQPDGGEPAGTPPVGRKDAEPQSALPQPPTLEEVYGAYDTIAALKAKGAGLTPEQAQQLDAAERTIAWATAANLLRKQAAMSVNGGQLNAEETAALAAAQARLGQAQPEAGSAGANGQPGKAQPSRPPLSVEDSKTLITNVMNMRPEERAHPTVQADLEQAKRVVAEDTVRRLEAQTGPLTEAQKHELAEAKGVLGQDDRAGGKKGQASEVGNAPEAEPLPTLAEAQTTIQGLHAKAADGSITPEDMRRFEQARKAVAQDRVSALEAKEANQTITAAEKRALDGYRKILDGSQKPPAGYNPLAANPAHRDWFPPSGSKPAQPPPTAFTPEALALSDEEIQRTVSRLKAQGHAWDRHGPEVLDGQLSDRAMFKADPMTQSRNDGVKPGNNHKCAKHASQFTSDRIMVQALKIIENSSRFRSDLQNALMAGDDKITITMNLSDVLGPNYKEHVKGKTVLFDNSNPPQPISVQDTDFTDGTIFVQFKKDASGNFYPNTMFANPKP